MNIDTVLPYCQLNDLGPYAVYAARDCDEQIGGSRGQGSLIAIFLTIGATGFQGQCLAEAQERATPNPSAHGGTRQGAPLGNVARLVVIA
jgi:hypothetical protein